MRSLREKLAALGMLSGLGFVGSAGATPIPVGNADFELVPPAQWQDGVGADGLLNVAGSYTYAAVDWAPWVSPDYLYSSTYDPGRRPDPRSGVAAAHSSNNGGAQGLYQNLTTNFEAGKTYRFRIFMQADSDAGNQGAGPQVVKMGFFNATDEPASNDGAGNLVYPSDFLITSDDLSQANGNFKNDGGYNWTRNEVLYTATADDAGKAIGIGVFTVSGANNKIVFDDASVDVGPFPADVPLPSDWRLDIAGDWNAVGNWTNGIPNGIDVVANFKSAIQSKRTIYTDVPVTVGTMNFDNPVGYLITGQGTLTLQVSTGSALINVVQGSHKINLPLIFASNADVNVATGALLTIADPVTFNAGVTVNKNGAGQLDIISLIDAGVGATLKLNAGVTNIYTNAGPNLHIVSGAALNFHAPQQLASLQVKTGGVATLKKGNVVMKLNSLSFDGATDAWQGKLDLTDNDLIVQVQGDFKTRQQALDTITNQIKTARGNGNWAGNGITTSAASDITGLAVILNDNGNGGTLLPSFDGITVDTGSVLVKFTYNGDMDLNGKVDGADYFLIDNGFLSGLGGYRNGDLDHNGKVDGADYFLIDAAFLGQGGILAGGDFKSASAAAVPEPSMLGLIVAGISMLTRRRRR